MSGGYAIAAGHRLTAEAGAEVLAAGGTAVDAVVAAAAVAMVAEPVLAGLLGGGFLAFRDAGGRVSVLDAFVGTPRRKRPEGEADIREVEADFGTARQSFRIGAATIAVPGLAAGLAGAHARAGRMPLSELLAPAVAHARRGVALTAFQARLGGIVAPILSATPGARALHCRDGAPLAEGEVHRNPELADVLEVFGAEGPRFVQEGEVARALLAVTREGGHLTAEDLARYRPVVREPLTLERAGARVALNPDPALGGLLVGFALELAERETGPAEMADILLMTCRARLEARLDDDAATGAAALRAPELLARYRAAMGERRARRPAALRGTTHVSAIDGQGGVAALTLSNGEGAGMILPGTGIMPNNMLGEDDLVPGGPFAWTPGMRLASMMAPTLAAWPDGRLAALGSGGSNRIRSALAQVLLALLDRGLPLADAIAAPRLHVEEGAEGARLDYERTGLAEADEAALRAAWPGATGWDEPSMFFGGVHGVARDRRGGLSAAGDARRGGAAITG